MTTNETYLKQLKDYKEKCNVLKQINSNKMSLYTDLDTTLNILTIVASIILTVVGFSNKGFIISNFFHANDIKASMEKFDFFYNLIVLLFLIVSILNLLFRFQDKSFLHNRAIISLSALIREINLLKMKAENNEGNNLNEQLTILITKYGYIVDSLPIHSDAAYIKAKKDLYEKEKQTRLIKAQYES